MKWLLYFLIFMLGFLASFLWLSFDPRVRIITNNKLIISQDELIDQCMERIRLRIKPVPDNQNTQDNQLL